MRAWRLAAALTDICGNQSAVFWFKTIDLLINQAMTTLLTIQYRFFIEDRKNSHQAMWFWIP